MEKVIRNHSGWDITIKGKRFCDRFWITFVPNMNYIFQVIQDEIYPQLATTYARQSNLSLESKSDRKIIEEWADKEIQIFIEDISTLKLTNHIDFPLTLFTSLEERIDIIANKVREEEYTPLDYYKVLQNDKRFDYRVKL